MSEKLRGRPAKWKEKNSAPLTNRMVPSPRRATAPYFSPKRALPRRQTRSTRRSLHYCSLTPYEQTSHNGDMAAPTEHEVCLILFAKNTGLKTRAGYFLPKRTLRTRSNRQPPSPKPARFAHTRAPRVSWWTVHYYNIIPITCSRKPCP